MDAVLSLDLNNSHQLQRAFEVFTHLRPHLNCDCFIQRVQLQREQGYKIIFLEDDGAIVAAAGYRIASFLAWGKVLYIDDLVTHPDKKRRGHGGTLLDWLIAEAKKLECDAVHLDTGFTRHDAHRLYLNKGFRITSHHMNLGFGI